MRALVCRQPGELRLETCPEPRPGPGDVLVQVRRIGICGTDYHIFEGKHPYLAYPRIMGHELSGEVLEAPPGSALRPGEAVIVNPYLACGGCVACRNGKPNCCVRIEVLGVHRDGGMCERIAMPEANLHPAGGLTLDAAAAVEFLAIGAHAVSRSGIRRGQRALVVGAGPIGLGAALFAGLAGAKVTVMDREAERAVLIAGLTGAERSLVAAEDARAAVLDASDGEGFDIVMDATGSRPAMEAGFAYVAHGGTYVLVSVVPEPVSFSDAEFHKREMTLMGSRNALASDFATVLAAIDAGQVPLDRIVTHRTDLERAPADLPRWAQDKAGLVKALIEV